MPGDRDDLPAAWMPGEEPLVDLNTFEVATRALVMSAKDAEPAPSE